MVEFFNILLRGVWNILNFQIPIDDGVSITPISIMMFTTVVGLIVKYVKAKGEQGE